MSLIALAMHSATASPPVTDSDPGKPTPPRPPEPIGNALQRLVEFIPVESITLFWIAVPACEGLYRYAKSIPAEQKVLRPTDWDWWLYGGMIAFTPLLLIVVYLSAKAAKKESIPKLKSWPWWRAFASALAFAVWALAVPGNPYFDDRFLSMGIWVVAFVVSLVLSLLDPIVLNWLFPEQDKPAG